MKETALKIRLFGDPALRKKAGKIKKVTQSHRELLSGMARLMYQAGGIGLAAPQVGSSESCIVVDIGSGLYKLINPKMTLREGSQSMEEGCLSVPGVCVRVKRAKKVLIKALDENGVPVAVEAQDLLACVFQHEIEHLYGKMIVDHASFLDRLKIKRKLEQLKKKAELERLSESKKQYCELRL